MAIVQNIKCYEPEIDGDFYHASCDTVKGQVDEYEHSECQAMARLKDAVLELGLEWPHVAPVSTGGGSTAYKIVDKPIDDEPEPEPEPEPKKEIPESKKSFSSKKKASRK